MKWDFLSFKLIFCFFTRLDQLELSLVALETAVDRLQQTVIAQFEAEARRLICSSLSSAGVLASYLALSNDCITGRSMDFFLLKVAVDLFGTEAPLAVLLRQIKPGDGQVESIIVQLTVPDHLQDRFPSAQQWFDEAVKRLLETGDQAPKLAIFPLKSRKVRRQVRYRVKLAEEEEEGTNSSDSQKWKAAEEALRRALQEVVEKKKDE